MAGTRTGRKNLRSYLALDVLEKLGIEPLKELTKRIDELEGIKKMALEAYTKQRGYGEKNDAGPAYLSNAVTCVREQISIYTTLSKFVHPTLSAIAVKDMRQEEEKLTERVVSAAQVRETILNDPFAMTEVPKLPGGLHDEENKEDTKES